MKENALKSVNRSFQLINAVELISSWEGDLKTMESIEDPRLEFSNYLKKKKNKN